MTTHFTNVVGHEIVVPILAGVKATAANQTFHVFKVPMAMTIRAVELGLGKADLYTATEGTVQVSLRFGAQTVTGTAYTSITTYVFGTSNTSFIDLVLYTTLTAGTFPVKSVTSTTFTNAAMAKNDYLIVEVYGTPVNNAGLKLDLICQVDDIAS